MREWIKNDKFEQVVNVGFIKCPQYSNIMKYCYNEAKNRIKNDIQWGEISTILLAKAIKEFEKSA